MCVCWNFCGAMSTYPCKHVTFRPVTEKSNLTHHLNKLSSSACIHIKDLPRSSRLRNSTSPDQPLWKEAWWGRFQRSSSLLHPSPGCRRVSPVTEKTVVCGFYAIPVTERTVVCGFYAMKSFSFLCFTLMLACFPRVVCCFLAWFPRDTKNSFLLLFFTMKFPVVSVVPRTSTCPSMSHLGQWQRNLNNNWGCYFSPETQRDFFLHCSLFSPGCHCVSSEPEKTHLYVS